jgi:hypothetical protein
VARRARKGPRCRRAGASLPARRRRRGLDGRGGGGRHADLPPSQPPPSLTPSLPPCRAAGAAAASQPRRSRQWRRTCRSPRRRSLPHHPPLPRHLRHHRRCVAAGGPGRVESGRDPTDRARPAQIGPGPGLTGFLLFMGLEKYNGLLDRLCMSTREPDLRDLSGRRRHFQAIVDFIVLNCFKHCLHCDCIVFCLVIVLFYIV